MTEMPFEVPQALRDLAEQNVKHAHAAYEQLTEGVNRTMSAWMGAIPSNSLAAQFKDIQLRAMDFAQDNADSAFKFACRINNAKSLQEILTLQTQFTQDRLQAFVKHSQELYVLISAALQKLQHA